jgi:glycosyltransferase involved in cell wall biosynthesis
VLSGDPYWIQTLNPRRVLPALRDYQQATPVWTEWESVPVLHFPYLCGYLFRPTIHACTYLHGLKRILASVRGQFSPDVIHAHTSFLDGTAGLAVRRATAQPLVLTEHTGPFSLLTRNAFMRLMTRRAVVGADYRLAVSDSLKRDISEALRLDASSIDVLPNGVDTRVFHPGDQRRPKDGAVRALWVGHHVEIKSVDRLLRAFAQAARIRPDLHLTLLGDGEGRGAAEHLAAALGLSDRVTFEPSADRNGVAEAMRAHDFLVVSSLKETFSLVAVEALACGTPVLSTACGGPESLITEPSLGLIVSNDVEGLTQGLLAMAQRAEATDPKQLLARLDGRYSWSWIADKLVAVYQRLLSASLQRAV